MTKFYGHSGGADFVEIIIRDFSGAKIETFRWNIEDKKTEKEIISTLKNKYGLFKGEDGDKDLKWLQGSEI
jgi:hypothetical protein